MAASLVVVSLKDVKPALDEETLLSPHIFILDQQILSSAFNKHVNQKDIIPFNLKGIMISHLMFVDDLLLAFCANKSCNIIFNVLNLYEQLTNLKVNLSKSNVYFSRHCPPSTRHSICCTLGIKEGSYPIKYLGAYLS